MSERPSQKALALAAISRAMSEAKRDDGSMRAMHGLLMDAYLATEQIDELKKARPKPKVATEEAAL